MSRRFHSVFRRTLCAMLAAACPAPGVQAQTYSQTETITYHDDTSKWVLGQVSTSAVNGITVAETTYSANAQPLTVKSFGKLRQTLTYDSDGTVATVKDGNNNITTLSSWKRGIPQSINYADGTTESAAVNDNGWITSITDENGYTRSYTYDAMGRLAGIAYPAGDSTAWNGTTQAFQQVTSSEYDIAAGHWRQTVATGNARKVTYFDALWRPLLTREYDTANEAGTQRFRRFAYDAQGRTTFASYPGGSDALGTGTWTEYDALGRTTSVSQDSELGLLTTLTEYLSGHRTQVTSPRGQKTVTTYQAFDQPSYDVPMSIQHPEGAYTDISRDVFGKPTSIIRRNDGGSVVSTRHYVYAWEESLCKSIEPETGATVYYNDGADNLWWSASGLDLPSTTDCNFGEADGSGRVVRRTYDARNRLKTLVFADGRGNQSWTYAADGLPIEVTTYNGTGSTLPVVNVYSYNRRRLMTLETSGQTGWYTWGLGYSYNANGHLQSIGYPDGSTVDYAPNALGQPTQAGSYATGVSYYPNGAIKQFSYGNGIVHTMTQNARQLPGKSTDCTASGSCATGDLRLDLSYAYDGNGNVSQIVDGVNGRQTRGMSYDGLDRLVQTTSSMFGTASYAYDVLDNLTQVTIGGGDKVRDQYYCYDGNWRLTNVKTGGCAGTTVMGLGYDAQGNLANRNGTLYGFDYGNRLREVTGKETYRYDGQGRRVESLGSTYAVWIYSNAGQLMFSHDARNNRATNYVYLGGSLVGLREKPMSGGTTETVRYQHTDAQGTPIATTDASKNVVDQFEYEPYGQLVNATLRDGPGYTGHVQDAATGLTYMQQRYYDPLIGRFLSRDPVTVNPNTGANFNAYWYANNNPYRFKDPDGRECKSANGTTTCDPGRKGDGLPTITFPTPKDFPNKIGGGLGDHEYRYNTDTGGKSDKSVQAAIAKDPTPGKDSPATPTGTANNASPVSGSRQVFGAVASPVKSYTATDPKGNTWTINVTQPGHPLHPGYVLRGAIDGKAISYGEGSGLLQAVGPVSQLIINDVWKGQNQQNIDDAK